MPDLTFNHTSRTRRIQKGWKCLAAVILYHEDQFEQN